MPAFYTPPKVREIALKMASDSRTVNRLTPTTRMTSLAGYLLNITGVNVVQFLVLTWFFAPYNSTGVAERLPSRSALHFAAAIFTIIVTAVWLKRSVPPRLTSRPLISKRIFILLDRGCTLVAIVAILRLTAPLLSIGGKIAPTGYFSWIGVLFVAAVLVKVLPAMVGSVLPSMEEVLASDPRKPILYLRSFEREQSKTRLRGALLPYLQKDPFEGHYMSSGTVGNKYMSPTTRGDSLFGGRLNARGILRADRRAFDEQLVFAHAFGAIGPYIALGRPTENYQDMDLGAAKKYVPNDEWQVEVERWLSKSAAVVIESADSAGLGWEIQRVVEMVRPTTVLIICPFADEDYMTFVERHGRLFLQGLPRERPRSRLLMFDNDWRPIPLQSVDSDAARSLAPFFAQLMTASGTVENFT